MFRNVFMSLISIQKIVIYPFIIKILKNITIVFYSRLYLNTFYRKIKKISTKLDKNFQNKNHFFLSILLKNTRFL